MWIFSAWIALEAAGFCFLRVRTCFIVDACDLRFLSDFHGHKLEEETRHPSVASPGPGHIAWFQNWQCCLYRLLCSLHSFRTGHSYCHCCEKGVFTVYIYIYTTRTDKPFASCGVWCCPTCLTHIYTDHHCMDCMVESSKFQVSTYFDIELITSGFSGWNRQPYQFNLVHGEFNQPTIHWTTGHTYCYIPGKWTSMWSFRFLHMFFPCNCWASVALTVGPFPGPVSERPSSACSCSPSAGACSWELLAYSWQCDVGKRQHHGDPIIGLDIWEVWGIWAS